MAVGRLVARWSVGKQQRCLECTWMVRVRIIRPFNMLTYHTLQVTMTLQGFLLVRSSETSSFRPTTSLLGTSCLAWLLLACIQMGSLLLEK